MLSSVKLVEVTVTWEIAADPRESEKINAEIGKVLKTILPFAHKLVFADLEGVRLRVDSTILSQLRKLRNGLRYVDISFEEVES